MKQHVLFSGLIISSMLLSSCGPKPVEVKDEQETKDTLKDNVIGDVVLIRTNIPNPTDIGKSFSKAGYSYMKSLLNPASKASGYSTKLQTAFGLGAYGADMGYIGSYNQNGDAGEYLSQIGKLAQQLKIESAFDPAFIQKMGAAKGDSINDMLNTAFEKAERNLKSNDRMATAALVITGGWIEGLHIAVEAIGSKPNVYAFQNVMDLLKQYEKDVDCKKMLEELKPYTDTFIAYGNSPNIGDKDLGKLKDAINAVRNKML
jgi:hypothetical protein